MDDRWWREIEAILSEIEQLDKDSKGQFRQISDREALDTVERAMRRQKTSQKVA